MPQAPSPNAPHLCPVCAKPFGKLTKLERHLLADHEATLSIAPGVLSPPSSPAARDAPHAPPSSTASAVLKAALADANAAFDAADPVCKRCPPATPPRVFRTRKDLAAHLIAKHLDSDMRSDPASPAVAAPAAPVPADGELSARSVKRPAPAAPAAAQTSAPSLAPAAAQTSTPSPTPSQAASPSPTSPSASPTPSPAPTPADTPAVGSVRARATDAEDTIEPAPKRARASGTKPPVTPRKPRGSVVAPKAQALAAASKSDSPPAPSSPKRKPVAPATPVSIPRASDQPPSVLGGDAPEQPVLRAAAAAAAAAAMLDFSSMGGFFANSDKSYYRLVDS